MKKRSDITFPSSKDANFNLNLFEHALKHPPSRNVILDLLASQDKSIFELFSNKAFEDTVRTSVKKVKKRDNCESPTALLRRRELEKVNRPESAQSDCSEKSSVSGRSSTLPFERILRNVVAYVEIKCGGNDRSVGAKALLKSMGATVTDEFSKNVTHVIFKDGSYQTYQRAKLLKVHFVSVLWIEASRRSGVRAPEINYPALGTKNYDQNISLICSQMQKEYEDLIREEIRHTLDSGTPLPTTKSLIDNRKRTKTSTSRRFETSSEFLNHQGSQDIEVENILQKIRGFSESKEPKTSSLVLGSASPMASTNYDLSRLSGTIKDRSDKDSDSFQPCSVNLECNNSDILTSDSECGIVNGDLIRSKNVIDETFNCVTPPGLQDSAHSNMEITCSNDSEDSESRSLLSNRYSSRRISRNEIVSMELTKMEDKVTTINETPKSVLKNLKENLLTSLSYLTFKNNKDSRKRKLLEKENCITPPPGNDGAIREDEFYRLKTPKLIIKKALQPAILSEGNVRSKYENTSKEENMRTQDTVETVMSSLRISDSKEKRPSDENKRGSTEMSSLRVSSDSKKLSTGTSMSSLKISKSSIDRSGSTNMSSLRISSENGNNTQKPAIPLTTRGTPQEGNATPIDNKKIDKEEKILSTPFVTMRKKRKNNKESNQNVLTNDIPNSNIQCELDGNNKQSLKELSENEVRTRTEKLALNTEIRKFNIDLKKRKNFHDKNKEIELIFNEKENKTTPFVNTKRRRRSAALTTEEQTHSNSINRLSQGIASRRKSARIKERTHENQFVEDIYEKEQLSDLDDAGILQQSKKERNIEKELSGNCDATEKIQGDKNILLKTPKKKIINNISEVLNKVDTSSGQGSKTAVVLLENILISPGKDMKFEEEHHSKSFSKTKLKAGKEQRVTKKNVDDSLEKVIEIKSQPERKTNFKLSRSKSESDVKINIRRSRRIRKLYDPNDVGNDDVHRKIRVNDTQEREIIRQEKITRINGFTQGTGVIGNVLLTQKAMEYLEQNKNNQKEMKILFKSPESVLNQLGIDKQKEVQNKEVSILNESSDEQVELAEEFVHKKLKVFSQPKKASQETQNIRRSNRVFSQKTPNTDTKNRRSTLEFEAVSLPVAKVRTKLKLDRKPSIVCTKMHRQDVQMFNQIVRKLGTFQVEDEVSCRTTHLVVGEVKRTINMLRALVRGCWILKQEWLLESLEKRKWLPEEGYEVTEFSPAVQRCRLEKSAFGPSYTMNIFLSCGLIYVAKSTTPRCSDLRELITICKGKITKMPDNAAISVGAYFDGCKCVNEYWILDSISAGKLKPLKKYLISKAAGKSPFV